MDFSAPRWGNTAWPPGWSTNVQVSGFHAVGGLPKRDTQKAPSTWKRAVLSWCQTRVLGLKHRPQFWTVRWVMSFQALGSRDWDLLGMSQRAPLSSFSSLPLICHRETWLKHSKETWIYCFILCKTGCSNFNFPEQIQTKLLNLSSTLLRLLEMCPRCLFDLYLFKLKEKMCLSRSN